ncbi:MauE/DoxX family redox-associated membrane protein [Longitalea arenae]|uniref:MauE/DoxX family redox-associated membrane protein n=1 Tax=Longitalea arenae TaxID=2812558 RepID=UPI001967E31C|nr:MauE/DoxX family redox-associated membrane protein [Longitalea arenae]
MIKRTTIIEIVTVLNIILFLYTGIAKIMDYSVFKEQLAMSPILSWAANPVALLLPWVEFAIVLMLVIPRWRLKGLYASLIMMTLFTIYIIALFSISTEMPCSCGGIMEALSWQQHIVFNLVFVLLNGWAIYLQKKEKQAFRNGFSDQRGYSISHT